MDYIIFDLELNSKPFKNRHPNEIIEIGAVKVNQDLEKVGSFQSFVKPSKYKKIFSIVKKKTHIEQTEIDDAESFRTVLPQFKQWIGNDYILCSWGHDDIHHLKTNCKLNHLGSKWIKCSIDLQKKFSVLNRLEAGKRSSLKDAISMLNIEVDDNLHRADVDAKYTAEIFIQIFDKLDIKDTN